MLNRVQLIGNLGRDPEVRQVGSGDSVANITIATTERWNDKSSGERQERTEWHRVVIWGPLAEVAEKYLAKGSKVYVSGQLQTRKWTDQKGEDKYTTEVVVRGPRAELIMLDSKKDDDRDDDRGRRRDDDRRTSRRDDQSGRRAPPGRTSRRPDNYDDLDDEIPF